jgi:hypothetical protein
VYFAVSLPRFRTTKVRGCARCDRGRSETRHWFRASVRAVCRRAASGNRGNAIANDDITGAQTPIPDLQLYITDTLGNPFIEEETLGHLYEPVAKSRRDANTIKKTQPITVVIGNPPYKNHANGQGGWIESGSAGRAPPMNRWAPPPEWGVGAHAHHLKNLYVYFWRWATLKVFGSGWHDATGEPEEDRYGITCFITVAGFLNGPRCERICAATAAIFG